VGRVRSFDYAAAVDRAMRLFWAKGYSGASLRDLLKVMGIGESSFYYNYGSKQRFYLECLGHYQRIVYGRRWAALAAEPSIKRGIRAFFKVVLDDLENRKIPNVCLLAGSLSADVLRERRLQRYVVREMRTLEQSLVERLRAARDAGELPKNFDVEVTAQLLVTFLQGFFRVVRTLKNRAELEKQVEALLRGIGL
jgi:TetR/AcrR family transcriptional repressor of nem operon